MNIKYKKFLIPTIIITMLVLIGILLWNTLLSFSWQLNRAYTSLNLPSTFTLVDKYENETDGDISTSSISTEVRVYRVSLNMDSTRDILLDIIERETDHNAGEGVSDHRLSMHTGYKYDLSEFENNCKPAKVPIKTATAFMDVYFLKSYDPGEVDFNEEGSAIFNSAIWHGEACDDELEEIYVAIELWKI